MLRAYRPQIWNPWKIQVDAFPIKQRCCPIRMLKSDDDLSRRCDNVSGGPMIFSFTQRFELKLRRFLSSNHRQIVEGGGQLQANKKALVNENRIWWKKRSESHKQSQLLSWIEVLWISISIHESYHWITSTLFCERWNVQLSNLDPAFGSWLAGFVHAAICQCLWSRRDPAGDPFICRFVRAEGCWGEPRFGGILCWVYIEYIIRICSTTQHNGHSQNFFGTYNNNGGCSRHVRWPDIMTTVLKSPLVWLFKPFGWFFGGRFGRKPFFRSSGAEGRRDESALEQGQTLRWINLWTYADWLMYVDRVIGTSLDHLCWTKMSDSDGISMGFGALPARVCFDTPKLTSNNALNLTQFGSYYSRLFITLVRFNFASLEVCDYCSSWTSIFNPKKRPKQIRCWTLCPAGRFFRISWWKHRSCRVSNWNLSCLPRPDDLGELLGKWMDFFGCESLLETGAMKTQVPKLD